MKQGHYWYPRPDAFIVSVSISNRLSWAADPDLTLLASALNLTLTLVSVATSNSAVLSSSWGLIVSLLQDCQALQKSQGQTDSVVWKIEQSKGRCCVKNALKVRKKNPHRFFRPISPEKLQNSDGLKFWHLDHNIQNVNITKVCIQELIVFKNETVKWKGNLMEKIDWLISCDS